MESRCRIPSWRADGLPRDLSMTNEERKREKAVKNIETAVRKAVGTGVSEKVAGGESGSQGSSLGRGGRQEGSRGGGCRQESSRERGCRLDDLSVGFLDSCR